MAYVILRKINWGKADWNQVLVFGIGFGIIEALLLGIAGFASAHQRQNSGTGSRTRTDH